MSSKLKVTGIMLVRLKLLGCSPSWTPERLSEASALEWRPRNRGCRAAGQLHGTREPKSRLHDRL